MRRLHAVGRTRSLDHDELRTVCGVSSLTELTTEQLQYHANRLEQNRPERRRPTRQPNWRPTMGASKRQRALIVQIATDAGWPRGELNGWLAKRHGIKDLDRDTIDSHKTRDIINQLMNVLDKEAAARGWQLILTRDGYELDKPEPRDERIPF